MHREELEISIMSEVFDEIYQAELTHGRFPTVQHGAAVTFREAQEANREVWRKPINRRAAYMEYKHEAASAVRMMMLFVDDDSLVEPGPFATRGDDMTVPTMPGA